MSIRKFVGVFTLVIAVPAGAQQGEAPIPARGAWVYDVLTDSSLGVLGNTAKACLGSDHVIDLDAAQVLEVDVGPDVRFVYAPVGPRSGSPMPERQLVRLRRPTGLSTDQVVQASQVPTESPEEALLFLEWLRKPAMSVVALARIDQRLVEAGPNREKYHRRCEK